MYSLFEIFAASNLPLRIFNQTRAHHVFVCNKTQTKRFPALKGTINLLVRTNPHPAKHIIKVDNTPHRTVLPTRFDQTIHSTCLYVTVVQLGDRNTLPTSAVSLQVQVALLACQLALRLRHSSWTVQSHLQAQVQAQAQGSSSPLPLTRLASLAFRPQHITFPISSARQKR